MASWDMLFKIWDDIQFTNTTQHNTTRNTTPSNKKEQKPLNKQTFSSLSLSVNCKFAISSFHHRNILVFFSSVFGHSERGIRHLKTQGYGGKTNSSFKGNACWRNSCFCKNSWCNESCRGCKIGSSSSCYDSCSNSRCYWIKKGSARCFQTACKVTCFSHFLFYINYPFMDGQSIIPLSSLHSENLW